MGRMGALETFLVNRLKARSNARMFAAVRDVLPIGHATECLEIGCGKGDMARRLVEAHRPRRYVATDYDESQIARARAHLAEAFGGALPAGLELRTADALDLPFADASFDAVLGFAVFHHVEDHFWRFEKIPRALREVVRVLRLDGHLIYQEFVNKSRIRGSLGGVGLRVEWRRARSLGEIVLARKAA